MIKVEKILVPVDFSACSRAALKYAIHYGKQLQATTIDVLHVWKLSRFIEPDTKVLDAEGKEQTLAEFAQSAAGQSMTEFLTEIEEAGEFQVRGRLESGVPHLTILQVAVAEDYDLIIMGTWGESTEATLGSIAQNVVRNTSCPVLVIPGPAVDPD